MMKKFEERPSGVCSAKMVFELDEDKIVSIVVENGCEGSSRGISALARGMKIEEFINRCKGIDCKGKGTSCPDQMASILQRYLDGK